MKPLYLVLVGILVGCVASGVEWTRTAAGEDSVPSSAQSHAESPVGRGSRERARRASPAKLIVGRWRDRAEREDAVMELLADGTGTICNNVPGDKFHVNISWEIGGVYENACLVNVRYEPAEENNAKPLPPEAKPFKMLAVFDGDDRFVFQRGPNEVTVMERQAPKKQPTAK